MCEVKNQINRENYEGDLEALYYRKSIFIYFLDYYLDQINSGFIDKRT